MAHAEVDGWAAAGSAMHPSVVSAQELQPPRPPGARHLGLPPGTRRSCDEPQLHMRRRHGCPHQRKRVGCGHRGVARDVHHPDHLIRLGVANRHRSAAPLLGDAQIVLRGEDLHGCAGGESRSRALVPAASSLHSAPAAKPIDSAVARMSQSPSTHSRRPRASPMAMTWPTSPAGSASSSCSTGTAGPEGLAARSAARAAGVNTAGASATSGSTPEDLLRLQESATRGRIPASDLAPCRKASRAQATEVARTRGSCPRASAGSPGTLAAQQHGTNKSSQGHSHSADGRQ